MDLSSWSASTLTRPRIVLAVVSGAAVISSGVYLFREYYSAPLPLDVVPGPGLHRSGAIRRPRRRSHGEPDDGPRRGSNATSAESHADENVDINTIRPQLDGAEAVVEETIEENWWDDPTQMLPLQRAGQNIVSLLFRVSEDNARRNAYVHRGCACNACGIVPIRGIRYRCANCADFDLCETCESQALHIKTHIFYKVKIPAPPFGPRQMQPVWYPGDPDTCIRSLPRNLMHKLSRETGFERPELEAFWEQWTFMANTEWREDPDDLGLAMDRKTFERCLVPSGGYRHTAPNLIHDRMFSFYDTNNDDLIGFTEFLHGLSYRKRKDKLRKIFDGYDVDRDGLVNRRDFLRIFRAYYVLYKQMHKDILEGLDDQVMSSTDAHQLISSRQPLSSLFGREGRVPQADHGRPMEGKIYHSNGDVVLNDDTVRAVSEDRPDTSNREEILTGLFSRSGSRHGLFSEIPFSPASAHPQSPSGDAGPRYWDALLNPPTEVQELPTLLIGESETRVLDEIFAPNVAEDEGENGGETEESGSRSGDDQNSPNEGDATAARGGDRDEPVDGRASGSESRPERRVGNERWTSTIPNESQIRTQHQAIVAHSQIRRAHLNKKSRVTARKKLHDRWKRRQFYLDEEEGAIPPEGWDEEEDILAHTNGAAESSKAAQHQPLSPRSRSSSKVRFAEDTDDYEIRSNPSTSSRSVPERWGGMDIPDAERDAGKEILYQVTQQAFNELLDILFKGKEDLAIRAVETKKARDKYRPLFESIELPGGNTGLTSNYHLLHALQPTDSTSLPGEHTLSELLARSGCTIQEEPDEDGNSIIPGPAAEGDSSGEDEGASHQRAPFTPSSSEDGSSPRDPTMPQFRPNSEADAARGPISVPVTAGPDAPGSPTFASVFESSSSGEDKKKKMKEKKSPKGADEKHDKGATTTIPYPTLVGWKIVDLAEAQAKEREGWGKLSYQEFDAIYKAEEQRSTRLDYLGSWIDFCIP